MRIEFVEPKDLKASLVVVPVFKGGNLKGFDKNAVEMASFTGEKGQTVSYVKDGRLMVLFGAGEKPKTLPEVQVLGGKIGGFVKSFSTREIAVCARCMGSLMAGAAAHFVYGMGLKLYDFDVYKTKEPQKDELSIEVVSTNVEADEKDFGVLSCILDGVYETRDLIMEPANQLPPREFVEAVKSLKMADVKVRVLDAKEMQKLGMNLLINVASGAKEEPYLLVLEYMNGKKGEKPVALVGKGVCYDSGGMNLKPAAGLSYMKYDMAGGATVVGSMVAVSKLKPKKNIVAVVPLVENMLSSTAQHVGDVWQSMNGLTVEVQNTDAEGRLILADALTYVQEKYAPSCVVDIATLTGVMKMVFADQYAGLFVNDSDLKQKLMEASSLTNDALWELPLHPAYDKMLASPIADTSNIANGGAGSATAAMFLKKFIEKDMPWAHIDMASVGWAESEKELSTKGATGYGVALLTRFLTA